MRAPETRSHAAGDRGTRVAVMALMKRALAAAIALSAVLSFAPRAEATIGGPGDDAMTAQIGFTALHLLSLGPLTIGNLVANRPWRAGTYVLSAANALLAVSAVFYVTSVMSGCCNDGFRTGVLWIEGTAFAWSAGLVGWMLITRDDTPPRAAAAVLPTRGGATASLVFTL